MTGPHLDARDGLYPSYDLLWSTATGHQASPRLLHYHSKQSHCALSAEQVYLLGLVGDGRTLGSALAELDARLARRDAELLRLFPQFALDADPLARTLERLTARASWSALRRCAWQPVWCSRSTRPCCAAPAIA